MERYRSSSRMSGRRTGEGPSASDLLSQMNRLNQTISDMILTGLDQVMSASRAGASGARMPRRSYEYEHEYGLSTSGRSRGERRHEGKREGFHERCREDCDECRECGRDECYCRCCIGDADLVIYARLFERRVVPITLVNERRREKKIHLELSEFKTRGGDTMNVKAAIVPPVDFTLPPCGEEQIILLVESLPAGGEPGKPGAGMADFAATAATAAAASDQRRQIPDVDECKVLYADLRVEGCDIRPVRIALALLPRDCNDMVIECGCDCC